VLVFKKCWQLFNLYLTTLEEAEKELKRGGENGRRAALGLSFLLGLLCKDYQSDAKHYHLHRNNDYDLLISLISIAAPFTVLYLTV